MGDAPIPGSADEREAVLDVAARARAAAVHLRTMTRAEKDAALMAIADALDAEVGRIVAANERLYECL